MNLLNKTRAILTVINTFLLSVLGIQNNLVLVPVRVQRKRFNQ